MTRHRAPAGSETGDAGKEPPTLEMCFQLDTTVQRQDVRVPCDRHGTVDIDALDDSRRRDYFFARVLERLGYARSWIVGDAGSAACADLSAIESR